MKTSFHLPRAPRSKAIFLAAQPAREAAEPSGVLEQIQEAVISLARAVFSRGGTLVMAGSTPLLSLMLTVAADYWESESMADDATGEIRAPLIRIFAADRRAIDDWWLGSGVIGLENERVSPAEIFPLLIRETRPLAMICLGGGGEVYEQAVDFRAGAPRTPIFVVESIQGDAEQIQLSVGAEAMDKTLRKRLNEAWQNVPRSTRDNASSPQIYSEEMIPYPLLMQEIVARFLEEK